MMTSIDNDRAVDAGKNWSVGGRTCNVEVKQNFQQELKEAGIAEFQWVSMANNEVDLFTKKLAGPEQNKHATRLCRHDKYYNTAHNGESHGQGRVSGSAECSWLKTSSRSESKNPGNHDKCARNQVSKRMNSWN